jgi:precorrin-4/cobalt-precorrin-4 C11-methyltransferase
MVIIGDAVGGEEYERSFLYGEWASGGSDTQEADD